MIMSYMCLAEKYMMTQKPVQVCISINNNDFLVSMCTFFMFVYFLFSSGIKSQSNYK